MKRLGLIGCGSIGRALVRALHEGRAAPWTLAAVLARSARRLDGYDVLADAAAYFAQPMDLVIEAAGEEGFRMHVPHALAHADVWAVSPAALADPEVEARVRDACKQSGHRLRILPGALPGLDAIATAHAAGIESLEISLEVAPGEARKTLFKGSAREAVLRFPDGVNVAVAAALAGPGLDATRVTVIRPAHGEGRLLRFSVRGPSGAFEMRSQPILAPARGGHLVADAIVAALLQESAALWIG